MSFKNSRGDTIGAFTCQNFAADRSIFRYQSF